MPRFLLDWYPNDGSRPDIGDIIEAARLTASRQHPRRWALTTTRLHPDQGPPTDYHYTNKPRSR